MARAKLREVAEAAMKDPKQALLDALGSSVEAVELFHNLVLVATYIKPPKVIKTPTGPVTLHMPDRTHAEDRFQGKVGLVVKLGPLAFKDDSVAKFGGKTLNVGDWVFYSASDGYEMFSVDQTDAGTSCRVFEDTQIKGRVGD